jgi:hypothetical protein
MVEISTAQGSSDAVPVKAGASQFYLLSGLPYGAFYLASKWF